MSTADAPAPAPTLDTAALDRLNQLGRPGAEPVALKTIRLFIESAPKLVQDLQTGAQLNDNDALRRAAHTLKSSSAIIGAMALSHAARQLEAQAVAGEVEAPATMVDDIAQGYEAVRIELERYRDALLKR